MAFHEDWATTRAIAALKAFTAVKSMITKEKLVYDNRTSLSDYDDSDESGASNDDDSDGNEASHKWKKPKKPKKKNLDDEDKKFFP